jgi:hypothetical protein
VYARGLNEDQAERARQLEKVGLHRYAERVRQCGAKDGVLEFRRCGLRCCPRCASRIASTNAVKVESAILSMKRPVAGVFTFISRGPADLAAALDGLARSMSALRREARKVGVGRFVGALHPKVTARGERWNAHVHAAFEVSKHRLDDVGSLWRSITRGRGAVEVEHHRRRVDSVVSYAAYITAEGDWCPSLADSLSSSRFDVLVAALRHRRLIVRWGFHRRPGIVWRVGPRFTSARARGE